MQSLLSSVRDRCSLPLFVASALALILTGLGCDSDDDPLGLPPAEAELRVAHLSPDAPAVDVWVDGDRVLTNVPYQATSDYLRVPSGTRRIQVTPAGAETPVVIDASPVLSAGDAFSVAATGLLGQSDLQPVVLEDDRRAEAGQAQVRFVHSSPDAPAVDVAVTGGPVLFSNVAFREAGEYLSVDPGVYDLEVRLAGSSTVVLTLPGTRLDGGTTYTVWAVGLVADQTLGALATVDS